MMYGMVESPGKTMMYMNGIDKGMTPQEAADHAEKWLFDYSLVKPSVKTIRNAIVGVPFITYATKAFLGRDRTDQALEVRTVFRPAVCNGSYV